MQRRKFINIGEYRELDSAIASGDITFGKACDILNQKAIEYADSRDVSIEGIITALETYIKNVYKDGLLEPYDYIQLQRKIDAQILELKKLNTAVILTKKQLRL